MTDWAKFTAILSGPGDVVINPTGGVTVPGQATSVNVQVPSSSGGVGFSIPVSLLLCITIEPVQL
jgi:hypothetical protein